MGPWSCPAANTDYHSRKGKNEWEGDSEIISAALPTTGPDYTGPGGKAASTFQRVEPLVEFQPAMLPPPRALGTLGAEPKDLEGGALSQKISSAVLGSNGICFTGFWTYLVPIIPVLCLLFWNENVYPMHVLPSYLEAHFGFMGSQLEKMNYTSSLTHTSFR